MFLFERMGLDNISSTPLACLDMTINSSVWFVQEIAKQSKVMAQDKIITILILICLNGKKKNNNKKKKTSE